MILDQQTKSDIELLLNIARHKVAEVDRIGSAKLFNEVSEEFGPIAHRVYLALDTPSRSFQRYHDESTKRVMLDPWTILNRSRIFLDSETTIDDPEFWNHADMVKTLCDYLALTQNSEVMHACA